MVIDQMLAKVQRMGNLSSKSYLAHNITAVSGPGPVR